MHHTRYYDKLAYASDSLLDSNHFHLINISATIDGQCRTWANAKQNHFGPSWKCSLSPMWLCTVWFYGHHFFFFHFVGTLHLVIFFIVSIQRKLIGFHKVITNMVQIHNDILYSHKMFKILFIILCHLEHTMSVYTAWKAWKVSVS